MDPNAIVLEEVRGFLSMEKSDDTFDNEILPHVNAAVGMVNQNGACKSTFVDKTTKWSDLANDGSGVETEYFTMIPLYIMLSTKMLFDPPPPSAIPFYQSRLDNLLWRLKIAYETREVVTNE